MQTPINQLQIAQNTFLDVKPLHGAWIVDAAIFPSEWATARICQSVFNNFNFRKIFLPYI